MPWWFYMDTASLGLHVCHRISVCHARTRSKNVGVQNTRRSFHACPMCMLYNPGPVRCYVPTAALRMSKPKCNSFFNQLPVHEKWPNFINIPKTIFSGASMVWGCSSWPSDIFLDDVFLRWKKIPTRSHNGLLCAD